MKLYHTLYTHEWLQLFLVNKTEFTDEVVEVFIACIHMRLLLKTEQTKHSMNNSKYTLKC